MGDGFGGEVSIEIIKGQRRQEPVTCAQMLEMHRHKLFTHLFQVFEAILVGIIKKGFDVVQGYFFHHVAFTFVFQGRILDVVSSLENGGNDRRCQTYCSQIKEHDDLFQHIRVLVWLRSLDDGFFLSFRTEAFKERSSCAQHVDVTVRLLVADREDEVSLTFLQSEFVQILHDTDAVTRVGRRS